MECTEEEEQEGTTFVWLCNRISYSTERESVHNSMVCMNVHMITYTDILTGIHINHSPYSSVPGRR